MNKVIIKNNFVVTVKREKNNNYGNPVYSVSIYSKYANNEEYNNINYLVYSKVKDVFVLISYDIDKKISEIFSEIENIFND